MGWLKKMIDNGEMLNLVGSDMEKLAMLKWGNTIEDNKGMPDIWHKNIAENMAYLKTIPERVSSARDIGDFEGKAAIVVGASPILQETWQHLKDLDDRFVIVASNSSAKFLVDNGVIPDYVLLIDGQKGVWTLDIGEENLKTKLVISPFCEPEALKVWKGKICVLPYEARDSEYALEICEKWGDPIPAGGNSINCAMAFLITCTKIAIYLLVGNELSFKKSYYVDKKSTNDVSMYFFATNTKGEQVRTLIPLWEYKIWMENLMFELYRLGYWFCNCSEGILGVDSDGSLRPCVAQLDLDKAIEQIKSAWEFEGKPDIEKSKIVYDLMYDTNSYFPRNGLYTWISFLENLKETNGKPFKKALDVGCGTGTGILETVDRGHDVYGVDIADNNDIWEEMGLSGRCKVAPANDMPYEDNEFDFVLCSDVMEHIPMHLVEDTLNEIYRVGSDRFLFAISNRPASMAGGTVEAHHTIAPGDWWVVKMKETGFDIVSFHEDEHHAVIGAIK